MIGPFRRAARISELLRDFASPLSPGLSSARGDASEIGTGADVEMRMGVGASVKVSDTAGFAMGKIKVTFLEDQSYVFDESLFRARYD